MKQQLGLDSEGWREQKEATGGKAEEKMYQQLVFDRVNGLEENRM